MKKWGPFVLTFITGILLGSSIGWRVFEHHRFEGRNPEVRNQRMVKLFSRKLALTPDQREKLIKILDEKRQKMDALRNESRPRFEALRLSTQDDIRAILNPDQIEKFNALEAQWEERRAKRHGPPHP
jgi:Spy/CpxP family protein refolding chaperone